MSSTPGDWLRYKSFEQDNGSVRKAWTLNYKDQTLYVSKLADDYPKNWAVILIGEVQGRKDFDTLKEARKYAMHELRKYPNGF